MTPVDRVEGESRDLRRENEALNEQIKLLVRTEQQVYRFRNEVDRQLSRIRTLSDFSLDCSRLEDPSDILERAAEVLLAGFSLDCVCAVWNVGPPGAARTIWRLAGGERGRASIADDGELAETWRDFDRTTLLPPTSPLIDDLLGLWPADSPPRTSPRSSCNAICLPLRLSGDNAGLIVAWTSTAVAGSFYSECPEQQHLPFLQLLAHHVERALDKAALTSDLRERGEELAAANQRLKASLVNLELTQQQLLQAQKMEAIGRLAGGIAHDFNNLLTVILGHAHGLRDRVGGGTGNPSEVRSIIEAGERAAEIVGHLLAFSRKQRQTPEVLDLHGLTASTVRMLARLIGEHIDLDVRDDEEPVAVRADRSHLEQILMNLVVNARDAMPVGGRVTIETRQAAREDMVGELEGLVHADWAVVSVSDTGHGMDRATRAQIFEPFFTTKEAGRGTGMGLSTVYGLVKQNGGHVQVASEPGHGSHFSVFLPRVDEPAPRHSEPEPRQLASASEGTVLLAEDERSIRELLSDVLRSEGYRVLEAADGSEALELASRVGSEIDVVVCDVVMPRLGGVDLVRKLRAERPGLPALFMSGYTFETLKIDELAEEPYLQKPFLPEVLLERVRQLLG